MYDGNCTVTTKFEYKEITCKHMSATVVCVVTRQQIDYPNVPKIYSIFFLEQTLLLTKG